MIIDVRSIPSDKTILKNPELFASWLGTKVLPKYEMEIGDEAYEYSKQGEVQVRFYPQTGVIVVPDTESFNLDYFYAKLYEFDSELHTADEDEQRHRYSKYMQRTKARDLGIALAILYIWYYSSGNPCPVPVHFWVVTCLFLVLRICIVYLIQFMEERDLIGHKSN